MRNYLVVSVQHPSISMLRIEIDGKVVSHKNFFGNYYFKAFHAQKVEIFFEPWGISPIIRFNHHMVDYSLVNINQYDHMLQFICNVNYHEEYFLQIINHKKEYFAVQETDTDLIDNFIGVDVQYEDLVREIDQKLK